MFPGSSIGTQCWGLAIEINEAEEIVGVTVYVCHFLLLMLVHGHPFSVLLLIVTTVVIRHAISDVSRVVSLGLAEPQTLPRVDAQDERGMTQKKTFQSKQKPFRRPWLVICEEL